MNNFRKAMLVSGLALVAAMSPASRAQALNSNVATVNLNAVLAESLTVAAAPATVNFTLVPNAPRMVARPHGQHQLGSR